MMKNKIICAYTVRLNNCVSLYNKVSLPMIKICAYSISYTLKISMYSIARRCFQHASLKVNKIKTSHWQKLLMIETSVAYQDKNFLLHIFTTNKVVFYSVLLFIYNLIIIIYILKIRSSFDTLIMVVQIAILQKEFTITRKLSSPGPKPLALKPKNPKPKPWANTKMLQATHPHHPPHF